jgi:hypothetical protein
MKLLSRHASLFLAVGLGLLLQFMVTVEWTYAYCTDRSDGPAYAVYGLPLPYTWFTGASSFHYYVMPHVYAVNCVVLCGIVWLSICPLLKHRILATRAKLRAILSSLGILLFLSVAAVHLTAVLLGYVHPVLSNPTAYWQYRELRPVGIPNDPYDDCIASKFWFPDGWKHN